MADFVLKNNLFEFNAEFYKQISGTSFEIKFAQFYACVSMDDTEAGFLKAQDIKSWLWKRFINEIFYMVRE